MSTYLLPQFSPHLQLDFNALHPVLPLIGAASVFTCGRTERNAYLFFLAMAVAFGATVLFRWVGVTMAAVSPDAPPQRLAPPVPDPGVLELREGMQNVGFAYAILPRCARSTPAGRRRR